MKKTLIVLAAAVFLAGCMSMATNDKNSSIWFDNKSGETVTCSVDGVVVFAVEPGKRQIYSLPHGEHKWEARSEKHFWHGTVSLDWGEIRDLALEEPGS